MIQRLLSLIVALAKFLEACASKEEAKAEAKANKARELLIASTEHRKATAFARKVASGLRDIQS